MGEATVFGNFLGYLLQLVRLAPHQDHAGAQGRQFMAVQRPMPLPPPVTIRVCPWNRSALKIESKATATVL